VIFSLWLNLPTSRLAVSQPLVDKIGQATKFDHSTLKSPKSSRDGTIRQRNQIFHKEAHGKSFNPTLTANLLEVEYKQSDVFKHLPPPLNKQRKPI